MKVLLVFSCVAALVVSLNACTSNPVDPTTADASARSGGVVSTSLTGPHNLTAVDAATLPAAITTYISTNYAGATIKEALKDAQGNYVVAITVSSVVNVLAFKADGTFVKVLTGSMVPAIFPATRPSMLRAIACAIISPATLLTTPPVIRCISIFLVTPHTTPPATHSVVAEVTTDFSLVSVKQKTRHAKPGLLLDR